MSSSSNGDASKPVAVETKKRGRWDQTVEEAFVPPKKVAVPATPTWDAEVSEASIKTSLLNIDSSIRKPPPIIDGTKHRVIREAKLPVQHRAFESGTPHQPTPEPLLDGKHRQKNPPAEIVGMRPRKRNEKHQVTRGPKLHVPIAVQPIA